MIIPNTLLAAARLAYPDWPWVIDEASGLVKSPSLCKTFNPECDSADAYALWKALALKAIIVAYDKNAESWYVVGVKIINTEFKTDIEAMLSAVETLEAMK